MGSAASSGPKTSKQIKTVTKPKKSGQEERKTVQKPKKSGKEERKQAQKTKRARQEEKKSTQKTIVIPKHKEYVIKGDQLGKYTDIYLRPSKIGGLEIKEFPPVKVTGFVVVEEDKFVVIDELKKIVTYTANADSGVYGKFGSWIQFKSPPRGMCRLEEDIYIAFADKTVKRIPIQETLTVENSFMMEYKCCGITTFTDNLAVALENGIIHIVNTDGRTIHRISLPNTSNGNYIARSLIETPDGHIMFCDTTTNTVMCVKIDGSVVFTYRGMNKPYCAIYDPFNNIIIIGQNAENGETIHLLTDKGSKIKVLKYRKELGMQPYFISSVNNRLALCGDSNKIPFYNIEKCRPRTKRELALQSS